MDYLNRADVLNLFKVSKYTIRRWEQTNGFPAPIRPSSRVVMYRKSAIDQWLTDKSAMDLTISSSSTFGQQLVDTRLSYRVKNDE